MKEEPQNTNQSPNTKRNRNNKSIVSSDGNRKRPDIKNTESQSTILMVKEFSENWISESKSRERSK